MCVLIFFYNFCLKPLSFQKFSQILSQVYIGIHVQYLVLSDINGILIFSTIF